MPITSSSYNPVSIVASEANHISIPGKTASKWQFAIQRRILLRKAGFEAHVDVERTNFPSSIFIFPFLWSIFKQKPDRKHIFFNVSHLHEFRALQMFISAGTLILFIRTDSDRNFWEEFRGFDQFPSQKSGSESVLIKGMKVVFRKLRKFVTHSHMKHVLNSFLLSWRLFMLYLFQNIIHRDHVFGRILMRADFLNLLPKKHAVSQPVIYKRQSMHGYTSIHSCSPTPNSRRMADSDHFSHKYWRLFVDHSCFHVRSPWSAPTLGSRPPGLKRPQPSFQHPVLLSVPFPIRSSLIRNMRSPDGIGSVSRQISSPKHTTFCTVRSPATPPTVTSIDAPRGWTFCVTNDRIPLNYWISQKIGHSLREERTSTQSWYDETGR
jgi:hypothetical protein